MTPTSRNGTTAAATAAGLAVLLPAAYLAAYLALTKSRVTGYEYRRGRNVRFTVRIFPTPALAALFEPAARLEGLLTRGDVSAQCPQAIAGQVPVRIPAGAGFRR